MGERLDPPAFGHHGSGLDLPARNPLGAAGRAGDLRDALKGWYEFRAGYDPLFTWWTQEPYERLRGALFFVSVLGIAAAAVAGLLVADRAVRPVARLTSAAERVATTRDLDTRIEDAGKDELGRLGRAFNAMMTALRTSKEQQDRLVHDASHELRTPLTSLRTNV